ncbi:FxLYD domain-containing protein [Haloarcula onubensis]|uniref:FxLYD domain-containing protein n=1 Tax=Haloarcula onubensis TaxID=2950539 RepID=A0ABU2FKJ3_9EURY|nr:FxLYD domain-containing protein [Halomicroarcula sp. S3CR25-11]MDS0280832.1 FxLYD domain-containing protein [Halomicroarcula sp. S3CR25-11]
MERRKLLQTTGAAVAGVSLAGCIGDDQGSGGGGEPTDDGDDEVAQGGPDQDSWFNLKGEVANDSNDQLRFTRVDLAQVAGGDGGTTGTATSGTGTDDGVFGSGNAVAAVTGTLENTANQPFEDVQVTATLYDQNDPIGQFFDSTEARNKDYLREDKQWQFTIVFEDADVDKATRYTVKADGDLADSDGTSTGNTSGVRDA